MDIEVHEIDVEFYICNWLRHIINLVYDSDSRLYYDIFENLLAKLFAGIIKLRQMRLIVNATLTRG